MQLFRTAEAPSRQEEMEERPRSEGKPTMDMSEVQYVGSSIGNFLLRKTLKEVGVVELVDKGIRIAKKDEGSNT